ncbi:MAG: glycosyltransferase family 4 protein [Parcubacteria group bacterium]|nr:glycosyltransferase family 4 protein [Parcubacteria group bacterium]
MVIGIDARVLLEGTGGVFVYAKNLLERLLPLAKRHTVKLFANRRSQGNDALLHSFARMPNVELHRFRFPNALLNASFRFRGSPCIDRLVGGCDVLFMPTFGYGAWSEHVPLVLTMHDISFAFFPECFTWRQNLWHRLAQPRELCRRASRIISVSESTKRDIVREYQLHESKIRVIHSGLDSQFRPIHDRAVLDAVRAEYGIPQAPIILQAGTIEPRKNGRATIAAFNLWNREHPDEARPFHLLFAGHRGWKAGKFFQEVRSSPIRNRIHSISDVRTKHLSALYSMASFFVYPSLYEGFGFPPLEAAGCGVPVIASANSSLGEVVGKAGLLIDPYRIESIADAFHALVADGQLVKTLRAEGLARTVKFDWDTTAKETLRVLESV